jgi:hypothetical protein
LPSGNSGVCLYGGVGWAVRGAFMGCHRGAEVHIARSDAILKAIEHSIFA